MDNKTQERIKADAEAYVQRTRGQQGRVETYIAGATAENSRAQVLVDALKAIKRTLNWIENADELDLIRKAIEQWKGEEEQETTICKLSTEEKKKLLAQKIESRMKEVGLQRQEFADLMGTQPSTITRWFSGKHNFQIDTLFEIEKQLNISLFNL